MTTALQASVHARDEHTVTWQQLVCAYGTSRKVKLSSYDIVWALDRIGRVLIVFTAWIGPDTNTAWCVYPAPRTHTHTHSQQLGCHSNKDYREDVNHNWMSC